MVNWFQYNHCSKSIGLELIQLQQIWLESELLTTTHLHGWTRFLGLGGGLQVLVGSGKNERRHEVQIRSLSAWSVSEKTWDILGPFARIQQHFLKTEDMLPSCTTRVQCEVSIFSGGMGILWKQTGLFPLTCQIKSNCTKGHHPGYLPQLTVNIDWRQQHRPTPRADCGF